MRAGRTSIHRPALVVATLLVAAVVVLPSGAPPVEAAPALQVGRPTAFSPVGPLRLADTRASRCGCVWRNASTMVVDVAGHPAIPDDARAVAVTLTALPHRRGGYLTAYPDGRPRPPTSTLNLRRDTPVANSTIVPLGAGGRLAIYRHVGADVVVDVTGVFRAADRARAGRFVPVSSTRLLDTREPGPRSGVLPPRGQRSLPLPAGTPRDATALLVNVTSVDMRRSGFLSVRPAGTPLATTSFLNTNGSGQVVAATVIAPTSPSGFTIYSHGGGHIVVDLIGWFTGPSAAAATTGLLVPVTPTRLLDTRAALPRVWPGGTREVPLPVTGAAALVTNVTITRTDRRGFVTAHPARTPRPPTSAINAIGHEHTVANLAITRASTVGTAYYSRGGNDLIVDLTGYFTGIPVSPTTGPPANTIPPPARVLLLGDSALAGLSAYPTSLSALRGFRPHLDAEPCRRLIYPSCLSPSTGRIPTTALDALRAAPGRFDIVYVDAGHNDWLDPDFPQQFDAIVRAARATGAHTIVWATYTENVHSPRAREAYRWNNAQVRSLTARPQYADVLLADWNAYSSPHPEWFSDGTHLKPAGAVALADFISRWVAGVDHRPCPGASGAAARQPCPKP